MESNKKLKILFIQRINLGGGIISAHYICNELAKLGHEVLCLGIRANNAKNIIFPLSNHIYKTLFLNSFLTNYIFVLNVFLNKYLKKNKIDVIISTGPEGAFLKKICKKNNILHIASYHHPNPTYIGKEIFLPKISYLLRPGRWLHYLDVYLERKSLLEADIVHCLCNWHKRITFEKLKIPLEKIFVVYLGVDSEKFNIFTRERNKLYNILHCGGLTPSKGIGTTLKALAIVLKKNKNVFLNIIGEADKNPYENLIKDLNLKDYIKIFGQISYDKMPGIYKMTDCVVFPTNHESFGLAIVEAMASGLPVIASNNTAVPEIIENQKSGILIPLGSPEALACEIINLVSNPTKSLEMGMDARKRIEDNFTWQKTAIGLEELILNNIK